MVRWWKDPQISRWINSKGECVIVLEIGNGNHFCFAKWQTLQWEGWTNKSLSLNSFLKVLSLTREGCPKQLCQSWWSDFVGLLQIAETWETIGKMLVGWRFRSGYPNHLHLLTILNKTRFREKVHQAVVKLGESTNGKNIELKLRHI